MKEIKLTIKENNGCTMEVKGVAPAERINALSTALIETLKEVFQIPEHEASVMATTIFIKAATGGTLEIIKPTRKIH